MIFDLLATWRNLWLESEQIKDFFLNLCRFGELEEGVRVFYIRPDRDPAERGEFSQQRFEAMDAKAVRCLLAGGLGFGGFGPAGFGDGAGAGRAAGDFVFEHTESCIHGGTEKSREHEAQELAFSALRERA